MILHACIIICLPNLINSEELENPSVIVVGAGASGIAAATKLYENFITNIKILEAEDRIGGRIHSVHFGDGIVDLGAQYCHGEKGNVAYELAKNFDILEPGLRGLQNNVYYSNGSRLDSAFIGELEKIYRKYDKIEDNAYNITKKSVEDLITYKYDATLVAKYQNDQNKLKIVKEGLKFLKGYILIHEGAFLLSHSSAERNYKKCDGNQGLIWKRLGYKAILDIMMKNYPDPSRKLSLDKTIHLNTKVKKIKWVYSQGVKVITSNGTYFANHVIFTPSVGVLKNQKTKLFDPPLSIMRNIALDEIGFDGVLKVFFSFSTQWWSDEDQAFSFFWSTEDLGNGTAWITQFRYILKVPDNPKVWVGWISGDLVPEIEKLPLDKLKLGVEQILKKFLGRKYNVTEIDKIIRSQWCTNKNFGGTYSFTKTGFYGKDQFLWREPLYDFMGKPVVLFAGEATHPTHYSTVHGAIETGYREAERIINFY